MDKLEKLPPKDLTSLKGNIAQGVISNTIFTVAWNGASAVIGLLTRHYALIFGIPPFLAIFLGVVVFFLMALSYNLIMRRKDAKALKAATVEIPVPTLPHSASFLVTDKLAIAEKPKLDFVVDSDQESHVHVQRGGSHVSRITADIKLRCERETDNVMVVRSFRLSLHRLETDGKVTTIPYQKEAQVVWENSSGKLVPFKDGWEIDKPRSDFRHYSFTIEITPQAQAELSPDHFLQLTMDAIGQDVIAKSVYVKDWSEGEYAPISLQPFEVFSPAAQKEIRQLKAKLTDYEKTNEKLGRHNAKYDWLTRAATEQSASINEWVAVTKCERGDLNLIVPVTSTPNVILCIWVTNKSVLDISISDDLGGLITFQDTELTDHKKVINPVKDLPSGETRCLTIKQRLGPSEVKAISDAQALSLRPHFFNLENLKVEIVGGGRSPDITAKPLKIGKAFATAFPVDLEKRGHRIRALSEARGSCYQLYEHFRQGSHEPLPKGALERWIDFSTEWLERAYKTKAEVSLVWKDITNGEPVPALGSGVAQQIWLEMCLVNLGEMIVRDAGEYSKFLNP